MRHTQLHGLYISLAQALLGQNAYASSAHSCQMGIKRGRKPAEGELEDFSRTTRWRRENQSKRTPSEERSFKQAEVDRVQACRRQARVDDADSGSAGNSDLSAEEEEDDTYKTRQQTLSFFDERYEYAACSFPAQHEQFRAEASHILRVHNEKLLRSFCFATQYIAASCPKDADDFTELRETTKTLPDQEQNSFFPHMDLFRRDRSFCMYQVHKRLWGKELELSEPKLNLWFFLDCVFRYLGNHSFFTDVLLHPEWFVADRSIYAEGLTTETRSRVVGAVEDAFRLAPQNIRQVHGCSQSWSGHPLRGPRGDCAETLG